MVKSFWPCSLGWSTEPPSYVYWKDQNFFKHIFSLSIDAYVSHLLKKLGWLHFYTRVWTHFRKKMPIISNSPCAES